MKQIILSIQTFHKGEVDSILELKKAISKIEKERDCIISYKEVKSYI